MKSSLISLSLVLFACGCAHSQNEASSPGERPVETPSADEPASELSGDNEAISDFAEFVEAFNTRDMARLDRLVPASGMLLLDNPGAFVRVRRVENVSGLFALEGSFDGARVKELQLSNEISDGPMPKVNCEDDKPLTGVYRGQADGTVLLNAVDNLVKYDLAKESEVAELRQTATENAPLVQFVVYDTAQSVKFYFGEVDGVLQLLSVDAVVPCSA